MSSLIAKVKDFHQLEEKRQTQLMFAAIALTVIVFNLIAIFGLDSLLHDDPAHYKDVIDGHFYWGWVKYFVLKPFLEWVTWSIMVYSVFLARSLYVLLFMVPLSWCFYYLFRHKFGISRIAAFSAAVIPNILPFQWQIPAGINISRTLYGLLFAVLGLVIGFHYLEKSTPKNWLRLVWSSLCYLISCLMLEQSLFVFPPLALAFFGFTEFTKKKIRIISVFFVIALGRYIQMIVFTRKPRVFVHPEEMLRRIGLYFKWSLPSLDIEPVYLVVFYMAVILLGFFLFVKYPHVNASYNRYFSYMRERTYALYIYAVLICWTVSTAIVFITMSSTFPPRYVMMSSFGINALFVLSVYIILNRSGFGGRYKLPLFFLLLLVIYSGVFRYVNLRSIYAPRNIAHSIIVRELKKTPFPANSYLVVCNVPRVSVGRRRSTGYLMRALERNDIKGLMKSMAPRHPYNFYDHFNPVDAVTGDIMQFNGIDTTKPVFFYLLLPEQDKLKQFEYVLHWQGKTKNAQWSILRANKKTGKISRYRIGVGMEMYLSTLKKLKERGISQSDILWGGPPKDKEQKRLERLELDPKLFQSGFFYYPFRFKKVGPYYVEKFLSVPGSEALIDKNICFEDRLQLVSVLVDEISDGTGKVTKFVHFLWKSLKKHTYQRDRLEVTLFKKGKQVRRFSPLFFRKGFKQEAGDYISGGIRIPAAKFKNADCLGIRVTDKSADPKEKLFLKVRGDQKIERKGTRVLIPINQLNKYK